MLKKVLILGLLALARPLEAATITVNSYRQDGPGCTIANAIAAAETDSPAGEDGVIDGVVLRACAAGSGADVIKIRAGVYTIYNPAVLDPNGDSAAFPIITTPITIEGDGPGATIIERYAGSLFPFRFFRVETPVFEIHGLTLKGGDVGFFNGGAIYVQTGGSLPMAITARHVNFEDNRAEFGGAISDLNNVHSLGVTFTLEDCVFLGNRANLGGAIAVSPFGDVVLARRTRFENNEGFNGGGAIYARPNRGAVINAEDTVFVGNKALGGAGGAIHSWDVQLTRVTMVNNQAANGGALDNYEGVVTIIDSTFEGNDARRGGAINAMGRLLVSGSTFMKNKAEAHDGGAIFLDDRSGDSRITNSTFWANTAFVEGTAISVFSGGLTLINDTITGNKTAGSWGPALRGWGASPTLRVSNSIIAGNTTEGAPLDVFVDPGRPGALFSLGSNLIGSHEGTNGMFVEPGDQVGTPESPLDPKLLDPADNGGPTFTQALAPGSLALDAGSTAAPGTDGACEAVDQRGVVRPGAGTAACDIGAFEHVITFPLTLHVGAGGSVFGLSGATPCVGGDCDGTFDSGTIVKLEAQPADGHAFAGWLGGGCADAAPVCFVTMDAAHTVTATFRDELAATTTTLTSSANPAVNGQDVTFTVVVASDDLSYGTPTGSVTFVNVTDGTEFGTAPLISGTATLTRTPRSTAKVLNEIKAIYAGNGTFAASNDTISQVVNPASTAIELTSSPSVAGQSVTITAVVSVVAPGSGSPTGNITFTDLSTSTVLDTVTLDGTGTATVNTALPSGIHPIRASYSGDQWFNGSDVVIQQIVSTTVTRTVLTSSPNPSVLNHFVTITATVTALLPGGDQPHSGTVAFFDAETDALLGLGNLGLEPTVVFTTDALAPGLRTIRAKYLGDAAHEPSHAELEHFVSFGDTETTLASSLNPSMTRDEVTFTAVVGTVDPGFGAPEGSVLFMNVTKGITLGTRTLDASGTASIKSALPGGLNTIEAFYTGNNFLKASSESITQVVNIPPPRILDIVETVTVSDDSGLLRAEMLKIDELVEIADTFDGAPQANTPTGSTVVVPSNGTPVTLTFAQVTAPGFTNVVRITGGVTPPIGFFLTWPPTLFEITTTAHYAGSILVCIGYPAESVSPRLMHYENGNWFDRTVSTNTATHTICGAVTSLSPFAVFVPIATEGRMKGDGAIAGGHEFDFRVAERAIGDERGALTYTLKTPKIGKEKARIDRFRATSIGAIGFWDDPAYGPARRPKPLVDSVVFTGTGTWNGAPGYSFEIEASDEGEPGRGRDAFTIVIRNPQGALVSSGNGVLTDGNIQSQRARRH